MISVVNEDCLDRPVWHALTTCQQQFSHASGSARRFRGDVSSLAGVRDESDESLVHLASLVSAADSVVVAQAQPMPCPPGLRVRPSVTAVQMVFRGGGTHGATRPGIVPLTEDDAPAMLALAEVTKPGPYRIRSQSLGAFWGVKRDGQLVAMAGERLKQPGYTEVSGVCTHPDFRAQGLAGDLSRVVIEGILDRGEVPYLHAFSTNEPAIRLYEALGFKIRRTIYVAHLERV